MINVLPTEIADLLDEVTPATDAASEAQVDAFLAAHTTASRSEVLNGWTKALRNHFANHASRHGSTVTVTVGAMKEARAGYFSARAAVDALRQMFIEEVAKPAVGPDQSPPRFGAVAQSEFDGILAWAVGQANGADLADVHERIKKQMPDAVVIDISSFWSTNGHNSAAPPQAASSTQTASAAPLYVAPGSLYVEHLEQDFWDRPSLQAIYDTALMQSLAPWAVCAHCIARVLALIRPCVTLPDIIGGPGSLNWIAAIAAMSAGGKGGAGAVARQLVPVAPKVYNLGSGEGVVDRYMSMASKGNPSYQAYESLIFNADEIDSMASLAVRSGSTLMSVIRSAFSGEQLGDSYIRNRSTTTLQPHTYRFVLTISVQPERAAWLLDGAAGGTLQRVMWFPGVDRRVKASKVSRAKIQPLQLADLNASKWQSYPRELTVPAEAEQLILAEAERRHAGELDALDGHALFSREKLAQALAIIDGRYAMDSEDWRLSGIAAEVSTFIRRQVTVLREKADEEEAQKAGRLHGVMREAADTEKDAQTSKRINRVAVQALTKLLAEPGHRMKQSALLNSFNSRDRAALRTALTNLEGSSPPAIKRTTDKSTNPPTIWVETC